jgi:hypothetical protein
MWNALDDFQEDLQQKNALVMLPISRLHFETKLLFQDGTVFYPPHDRSYAVARSSGGHALSGSGRRSPC